MNSVILDISNSGYAVSAALFAAGMLAPKYKIIPRLFNISLSVSFVFHCGFFVARYFEEYISDVVYMQYLGVNTLEEKMAFFALALAFIVIMGRKSASKKILNLLLLVIISAALRAVAAGGLYVPLIAPPYQASWMSFCNGFGAAGFAFLFAGFLAGILYLFGKLALLSGRNPVFEEMRATAARFIYYGLPLFSVYIVLRACWTNLAWGRWWLWSNEEMVSLTAWLCYMLYIYVRENLKDWETAAVIISVAGFASGSAAFFIPKIFGFSIFNNF